MRVESCPEGTEAIALAELFGHSGTVHCVEEDEEQREHVLQIA